MCVYTLAFIYIYTYLVTYMHTYLFTYVHKYTHNYFYMNTSTRVCAHNYYTSEVIM